MSPRYFHILRLSQDLAYVIVIVARYGAGEATGLPFSTMYVASTLNRPLAAQASWGTPDAIWKDSPAFIVRSGWPSTLITASPSIT